MARTKADGTPKDDRRVISATISELLQSTNVISFVDSYKFASGKDCLAAMRGVDEINARLAEYERLKDRLIKDTGKTAVSPTDPEYQTLIQKLSEAMEDKVEIHIKPVFDPETIGAIEPGILRGLIRLGFAKDVESA